MLTPVQYADVEVFYPGGMLYVEGKSMRTACLALIPNKGGGNGWWLEAGGRHIHLHIHEHTHDEVKKWREK